jgi:hypothetical protein
MKAIMIAAASMLAACASPGATAQTQQPPPCSAAENRQLDFWVGTWDVSWDATPSIAAGSGVNRITRELGGCVVQEAFEGGPTTGGMVGHSVSLYHAPSGAWRQTWVDNFGGYFALTGGMQGDRFILVNSRLSDQSPHLRMVFEDITANAFTWRWQGSPDGETWSDRWLIRYVRRAE